MNESATLALFTISGLEAFTNYCAATVAEYQTISGITVQPEVAESSLSFFITDVGVPDAPSVQLMQANFSWTPPNAKGSAILSYRLIASRTNASTVVDPVQMNVSENTTEVDLNSWLALVVNEPYDIIVHAVNAIGESPPSNEVDPFTRLVNSNELSIGEIIGIVLGGVGFIALICCAITFPFLCCYTHLCYKSGRKHLSTFGQDTELKTLREIRQLSALNPHSTSWSRSCDDYICTDDELERLTKLARQNLKLENFIGHGQFGEVYQGSATDLLGPATGHMPVAIKVLRKGSSNEEQRKFLSEAALMSKFDHRNIVKVLGVCVDNNPVYIVMELMPGGDLLKFLRAAKSQDAPVTLKLPDQLHIAIDVAQGCCYLEKMQFIHGDLAARNCLISSYGPDRVVKIGDFGLAKDFYSSDYYQVEGQRKLPVKWLSPEALSQGKFTTESDIWAYGVLLWEILSLGDQPYPGQTNQEVVQYVTSGGRLGKPEDCPDSIYQIMLNCWEQKASDRQHFQEITVALTDFTERQSESAENAPGLVVD